MRLSLRPALACVAMALATFGAPAGHAAAPAPHAMRPHVFAPNVSYGSGNLTSHGGPVENGSNNYLIYWGGVPGLNYPCQAEPLTCFSLSTQIPVPLALTLERFFGDVSDLPIYRTLAEYGVTGRSRYSGSWSDPGSYPSTTLTDAQVQAEIRKAQIANGWPSGNGNNYWVITGPGYRECEPSLGCSGTDFCAYHGTLSDARGVTTPYGYIPYPENTQLDCGTLSFPNVQPGLDDQVNLLSHELFETLTDPMLNAWYDAAGYEIADKCAWLFGAKNATGGDTSAPNGTTYYVQEEYRNSRSDCVMS